MLTANLLFIPLLATTALAHFTLDFPTSRGFDEDKEPDFCGGFTSVSARQSFPLSSGSIWIDSHHTAATVDAFLSVSENPASFDDFNSTSNGTAIPMVTSFFQLKGAGEYCWNVNLEQLGIGLTNGSLVTLQIQYNGGDGNLYQCTDLVLRSDFTLPSNVTCPTDKDATQNPTATVSLAGSSATSAASQAQGSSSSGASQTSSRAASSSSAAASSTGAATLTRATEGWQFVGLLAGLIGVTVL